MGKKILIVDDEPDITQVLVQRLQAEGYAVAVAADGLQGVQQAHHAKPDLILLDMRMPAGDGMTVYDNLKMSTHTMAIPVIFITAYALPELADEAKAKGAAGFFAKPFEMEALLAGIHKALGE